MAIGDAIRRYQEEKEERAAREAAAEASVAPTTPAPPIDPTMATVLAQMAAIMERLSAPKADIEQSTKDAAYKQIELIEKLITKTHPENVEHPDIGVYTYPEGNVARPKPELQHKTFWVGYELRPETLTPTEIELLNRLTPGEYRVTKADGVGIPFRVSAKNSDKLDANGRPTIEELSVWFPCKGDNRQNHMSMVSYIRQALGDKIPTVEELTKQLVKLKRELEQAKAGVIGPIGVGA